MKGDTATCPCGGSLHVVEHRIYEPPIFQVVCERCGKKSPGKETPEQALAWWVERRKP